VTLTGLVDPHGQATTYRFEFGPTAALGAETPPATTGTQSGAEPVAVALAGLDPGTTYHYRLAATNLGGTVAGETRTVTTADPCATCDDGDVCTTETCTLADGCTHAPLAAAAVAAALRGGLAETLVAGTCRGAPAAGRVSRLVAASGTRLGRAAQATKPRAVRRQLERARRKLAQAARVVRRSGARLPAGCGTALGGRVSEAQAHVACLLAARAP
jgi:hypothetical protein